MGHDDALPLMVTGLLAASCFEDAAAVALRSILATASASLAQSPNGRGKLLRAVLHLRPGDGYRRLVGVEHPSGTATEGTGYLTSATAWRWVTEHGCSVSIDVEVNAICSWFQGVPQLRARDPGAAFPSDETRERLLDRHATHVHVVPLRTSHGGVAGMISLEANCPAAIGQDFIWSDCNESLQLLADIATPYLTSLPLRPSQTTTTDEFLPVIGPTSSRFVELLRAFAQQEETLLVSGPTGVGKSRLARWCHEQSKRREQRFEVLDLLSVPEELQMAELFGWKRGAFTSAVKDNPGAIARAAKGTLFIDEIDKLSLKAQAGLLHVLEDHVYRPMGEDGPERRADVRFVIGTNTNLMEAVRAGRFREDLYYRIHVLPVPVPPLGERLDELPLWAAYMLNRRHRDGGGEGEARLDGAAEKLLLQAQWPGNLRQLDNVVRRAYTLALIDHGGARNEIVLGRRHVERALTYENAPDPATLLQQLWKAAHAFVEEAEQRERAGSSLSLDLADAFRGMILAAAVQRLGNRDDAFGILGQKQAVKNRNHQRTLRREIERVRELLRALGGGGDDREIFGLIEPDEPGSTH